jgi:hypothetical protein
VFGNRIRNLLVDSPTSLGARARIRRWEVFRATFPEVSEMRVLDLGGTVEWWHRAPVRPAQVTVLNLAGEDATPACGTTGPADHGWGTCPDSGAAGADHYGDGDGDGGGSGAREWVTALRGDACDAREALALAGRETSFDLVFSNSLIEHVGGHARRVRLAEQIRGLAPRHWVQTPYRYFPLEPHWLFPGAQFLPARARVSIARSWPLVHTRPDNQADARESVLWTELLGMTEMRTYFPDSRITWEQALGLPKSLIAVL